MDERLHFENFTPGDVFDCGSIAPTRDEMIAFAAEFDPQPFHLDDAAAEASLLGELAASGWHTNALMMRVLYDGLFQRAASQGSPGMEEVRWLTPVRPGRPFRLMVEIADARASKSRPTLGLVSMRATMIDETEAKPVCEHRFAVFMLRRGAPPPTGAESSSAPRTAADDAAVALLEGALPPAASAATWFDRDAAIAAPAIALGAHVFDADGIVAFAKAFDPQPFHVDPEAAKRTLFGGLCASGWQTAAVWMQLMVSARRMAEEALPVDEQAAAMRRWGPSPGVKDLRWLRPVYAGDRLRYAHRPSGARALRSRPGWFLLTSENVALNQDDALVYRFTGQVLQREE